MASAGIPPGTKSALKQDWAAFASACNGAGYKKRFYDAKLKTAYDQFAKDEVKK